MGSGSEYRQAYSTIVVTASSGEKAMKLRKPNILRGNRIGFDCETTGLSPWLGCTPFAFSFANEYEETAYYQFDVDPFTREVQWEPGPLAEMKQILEDPTVEKVGHNLSFDRAMMEVRFGIQMQGKLHDTALTAHICNNLEFTFELKPLCMRYGIMDDDDEFVLASTVKKLRRQAKKLGWKIGIDSRETVKGTKTKTAWPSDYWIPRAFALAFPNDPNVELYYSVCETYAVKDAIRTLSLFLMTQERMEKYGVSHIYNDLEQPLSDTVYRMRRRGARLDREQNAKDLTDMYKRAMDRLNAMRAVAGEAFNPDSPPQLSKVLFQDLGLPFNKERVSEKTKNPSVDADALVELERNTHHPFITDLLKYRGATKAYSYFYIYDRESVPCPLGTPGINVLHPEIRQLKPATGRFSMANPNLQQVTSEESSRSPDPIDARGSFGPRPGYAWVCIDYKGMEVRVFADVAQEPNMLRAIAEGREIHDEVCDRGWGGPYNAAGITECIHVLGLDGSENFYRKEMQPLRKLWGLDDWKKLTERNREDIVCDWLKTFDWSVIRAQASVGLKVTKNKGKMVTFCKIYGGRAPAIADLLHVPIPEAQEFLDTYDAAFPRIEEYAGELQEVVHVQGYITTCWGRRLNIRPDLAYQCVNYMVQGSSADLLKSAMLKSDRFLQKSGLDCHLTLCVHDELIFEANKKYLTRGLVTNLCGCMEDTDGKLNVPMPTDPSIAWHNWREKQKVKL